MRPHPHLYELNTRLWLRRLSAREGREVTLGSIPDRDLDALAGDFDLVWLMGVWRRSAAGRERALAEPGLRAGYTEALPDFTEADVEGSPYAVAAYHVEPDFGTDEELRGLRARLNRRAVRLIVDFVPNHLAMDHRWTREHPSWFVRGTDELAAARPGEWFRAGGGPWLAHGRDPYFPPWTDTVQANVFEPALREAMTVELERIATLADGVRCDMAMLVLNEVFERTWRPLVGPGLGSPGEELWARAIARVRAAHLDFLFFAEAYWGLEKRLLELGFDGAYDKGFYDRAIHGPAPALRAHLEALGPLTERGIRFLENHDERRAASAMPPARARAAAAALMTLPGIRLVHDGQLEGRRRRIPVQLLREPDEPVDAQVAEDYRRLLELGRDRIVHEGHFELVRVHGADSVLAWSWTLGPTRRIVAINFGPETATLALPAVRAPTHDLLAWSGGHRIAGLTLGPWAVRCWETES